jgi:hypothetical protein
MIGRARIAPVGISLDREQRFFSDIRGFPDF